MRFYIRPCCSILRPRTVQKLSTGYSPGRRNNLPNGVSTSTFLHYIHKVFTKRPLLLFYLIIFPCLFFSFNTLAGNKQTIYFYNPEININNFASLKKEFDTYLSAYGEYQLQPFSEREIFEKVAVNKNDGIFIISGWHYKKLKETIPIEPVLVAVSKNKSTCRKILSAKKNINNLDSLKNSNIASASSEDYTRNIIKQMLGETSDGIMRSVKVLSVPKDIDALMSVGFGVAEAALTTENSFSKLAAINQKQYEMLKQLLVSEETLLPIVAVPKSLINDYAQLLKVLEKMGLTPEGKNRLNMLGFDGWKILSEQEKRVLGK